MSRLLPVECDVLAPDGSEVRILEASSRGSMAHFTLQPGQVSKAVRHKSVEELWFILSGEGRMWMEEKGRETTHTLVAGLSLAIHPGTSFQFRCDGSEPLRVVAVTMPPWPGEGEAVFVKGGWPSNA